MWVCPKCKQRFVNNSQWHSCGKNTVDGFLKGKTTSARKLFWYFVKQYQKIGPFDLHPAKTRVAFAAQIRFAGVTKMGKDFIQGGLLFTQPYPNNRCFYKIERIPAVQLAALNTTRTISGSTRKAT